MSHLSFARIMYGAGQENPSPALMPVSNRPSHIEGSPQSGASRETSYGPVESLLHKAMLVFSRNT